MIRKMNRLGKVTTFGLLGWLLVYTSPAIAQQQSEEMNWAVLTAASTQIGVEVPTSEFNKNPKSVQNILDSLISWKTVLNGKFTEMAEDPVGQLWNLGVELTEKLKAENRLSYADQLNVSATFVPWKKAERNIEGNQLDLYLYRNWRIMHEKQRLLTQDQKIPFYPLGSVVNLRLSEDESYLELQFAFGFNPMVEPFKKKLTLVNVQSIQVNESILVGESPAAILTLYFPLESKKVQNKDSLLKKAYLKLQFGMLEGLQTEAGNNYFKVHEDEFLACSRKRSVPTVHTKDGIFDKIPIDVLFYGASFQIDERQSGTPGVKVIKARAGVAPWNIGCVETPFSNGMVRDEMNRIIAEDTQRLSQLIYILIQGSAEETADFIEKERAKDQLLND
jgi:hypothetical protein